jgi:uncharacterized protein
MTNQCEHIELSTTHPGRARDFYAALFGWKIKSAPTSAGADAYMMFQTETGGGGITAKMAPEQPTAWMPYISVESVADTLAAAVQLGADTVMGHTPIGNMGAIAVLRDPTGATIGLWEMTAKPAPKPAKAPKAAKAAKTAKPKAANAAKPKAKAPAKGKQPAKGKKGKKGKKS